MKTKSLLHSTIRTGIASLAVALVGLVASAQAAGPKALKFTAGPVNTSGSVMTLDHPLLNNKPTAKPIITQRWTSTYNNHPTGVSYNASSGRWRIINEDSAAISNNVNFNVLLAPATKTHLCTPANTFSNRTFTKIAKNKPASLLQATHVINPIAGIPGTNHTKPFGVWFNPFAGDLYSFTWNVYNDDLSALGTVGFHIADVTKLKIAGQPISFIFTTNAGNISGNVAYITNPLTDNMPNAVVFVRHLFSTSTSPTYLDKHVGVWYNANKWSVFTEDSSTMPTNVAFVVTVVPTATP